MFFNDVTLPEMLFLRFKAMKQLTAYLIQKTVMMRWTPEFCDFIQKTEGFRIFRILQFFLTCISAKVVVARRFPVN